MSFTSLFTFWKPPSGVEAGHFVVWRVLAYNDRDRPDGGTLSSHGVHAKRGAEAQRIVWRTKKIERADASVIGTGINLVRGQ